jgi:hypothetical protein
MQVETRNTLQAILASTPDNAANAGLRASIAAMLNNSGIAEQMYWYSPTTAVSVPTVALGATATANLTIQADAPFLIEAAMLFGISAAGSTALNQQTILSPLVLCTLNDQSGVGPLMPMGQPVQNLFGLNGVPLVWPCKYLIPANGNLQLQFTNYDTALGYTLYPTFFGVKLRGATNPSSGQTI